MSEKLYDRLEQLELAVPKKEPRSALVKYWEYETPEEGWRRENGDEPFPTKPEYDWIMHIKFVTARWDENGRALHDL